MDPLDSSGRTVPVAGGAGGIGNGIARSFPARGATVHAWGARPDAANHAGGPGSDRADGRRGFPQDMGDAALFPASSVAGYVTGDMLAADGGPGL